MGVMCGYCYHPDCTDCFPVNRKEQITPVQAHNIGQSRIDVLTRQLEAAVEGLKWYGDRENQMFIQVGSDADCGFNWSTNYEEDKGKRARETLAKIKKIGEEQ